MRELFIIIFAFLAGALVLSAVAAGQSKKAIADYVVRFLIAMLLPVTGNLIIVSSKAELPATVGCYIYFLGMDVMILALLMFTLAYCRLKWPGTAVKILVYGALILDAAQLLLNIRFGHAFSTEKILVDGMPYYRLVPYLGQVIHRVVCYGLFFINLLIFFVKMVRAPKIYRERYSVIFFSMIVGGIWQSIYILSRTPVDRSMIGFGVFSMLVFYFALYYRPVRLLDRMLAGIASELPEALFFFDAVGRGIWANKPGMKLLTLREEEIEEAGEKIRRMFGSFDRREEWTIRRVLGSGTDLHYYILQKKTVKDEHGRVDGSFLSIRDNTEEHLAMRQRLYEANHDHLTGLYTRTRLYEHIRDVLEAQKSTEFLVAFLDIADFKIVNDIFGNTFGDYALKCVADWIRQQASPDWAYGRLAGDTFGALIPVDEFRGAEIEKALSPFVIRDGNIEHSILIHIGVYEITEPELDVSVMFDRAHMALTTIKNEYQVHIARYDDRMRQQVLWSQRISAELPKAIETNQIRPYLQAIVNNEGRVVGAEALVRWFHPEEGFLSPARFIPVFEENGMIADVDRHMWHSACAILAKWKKEGRDLFLSVNISPKDFYFMDVASEIRSAVEKYGIEPRRLRLEITETVMMTDIDSRMKILQSLRDAGFLVEMDDFGSGYSSLNLLQDMPVDIMKIDMLFLKRAGGSDKAKKILNNILHMTQDLELPAVTEGVEEFGQYQMLRDMGCALFQGYYFAKPEPLEAFEQYSERAAGA